MSQNVNSVGSATEKKIGYSSETELIKEFKQYLTGHLKIKESAANYLYHSLVDDMILGLVLQVHHDWRLGLLDDALEQQPENCDPYSGENSSIFNAFDQNTSTKKIDCQCICTRCNGRVAASGFAPHLQRCMGMQPSRLASRMASRRLATRESTTYYGAHASDEDDDEISEKRKRRNNSNVRSNGKRNGKT